MYPRLLIDLKKIRHNLRVITDKITDNGCSIMIVTKVVCADSEILKIVEKNNKVKYLADSRIENIMTYNNTDKDKVLIRIPMKSDVKRVVKYSDISLNSEIETIKLLNEESVKQSKTHKVILMIDMGDLREGMYYTDEKRIYNTIEQILKLSNIELCGIGVNLTCYGAIIPTEENLGGLVNLAEKIEDKFNIRLDIISGGNSSSLHLLDKHKLPKRVNNLRIGEAFYLANETAYSNKIDNMYDDAIKVQAEIVEIEEKPSMPVGISGVDAFGKKPVYKDRGKIKRAIVAIGKQDIDVEDLKPLDSNISVLGGSSDHTILDITKCDYSVGDVISFIPGYSSVLKSFTSKYVSREYV